jgi:DNA topoisomerase-1
MHLIIVESPTKAKTLKRFLGDAYRIEATMGHIRDLPKAELGVDVEKQFLPRYIIPRAKAKRVGELKDIALEFKTIILATDPDREGEAIAWHVSKILEKKNKQQSRFSRIVFHEITKEAILDALKHPRQIDLALVNAQQARRILDRLVGYKLSPLLRQKLSRRWLSAGRVQSIAVRLIVEREREIAKFLSRAYWTIEGTFTCLSKMTKQQNPTNPPAGGTNSTNIITAQLVSRDGQPYEITQTINLFDGNYTTTSSTITTEKTATEIIHNFKPPYTVSAVDTKEVKRFPPPPYTTSTLQQDAGRRLGYSARKTMQVAQKLYEEGYITYHRTDSVHLSNRFLTDARRYIEKIYGQQYCAAKQRQYQTKSKVAQEAHEAIRPIDATVTSDKVDGTGEINRDHHRLYDLIWKRALASQAKEAVFNTTTVDITSSNFYAFEAKGSIITFDGFLRIVGRDSENVFIPKVARGDTVALQKASEITHVTAPPPRYTEASLVKALEEKDIGRPSTYAPIISTIQDRQYVTLENKKIIPTELGNSVTDFLVKYFPDIMELPFTAHLEGDLDAIANGLRQWEPVVGEFYAPFIKNLETTYEKAEEVKITVEETGELCPECGKPLVIRMGRYGKFIACSTFPACTYRRQLLHKIDRKCPKCAGDIVIKKSRRGKMFYGCSNYPSCTFAAWKKEDIK